MNSTSKQVALILIFLFGSIRVCWAQDSLQVATTQQKADVVALRMEQELSLTKDQTQRVATIALERFETLKKSTTNKAKQLATANDLALKKLAEVLTTEQFAQYNQTKSETKKQKDEFLKKNPNYKFTDQEKEMDF